MRLSTGHNCSALAADKNPKASFEDLGRFVDRRGRVRKWIGFGSLKVAAALHHPFDLMKQGSGRLHARDFSRISDCNYHLARVWAPQGSSVNVAEVKRLVAFPIDPGRTCRARRRLDLPTVQLGMLRWPPRIPRSCLLKLVGQTQEQCFASHSCAELRPNRQAC